MFLNLIIISFITVINYQFNIYNFGKIFDFYNHILELKKVFRFNDISDEKDEYFWKKLSQNYTYFKTSLILADPQGVKINGKIIV